MKPGRDLDILIAEKVFTLKICTCTDEEVDKWKREGSRVYSPFYPTFEPSRFGSHNNCNKCGDRYFSTSWDGPNSYSTDIAAAWEVVEKFIKDGKHINIAYYQKLGPNIDGPPYEAHWTVTGIYAWDLEKAQAETAPHAICLAALKAVGIDPAQLPVDAKDPE